MSDIVLEALKEKHLKVTNALKKIEETINSKDPLCEYLEIAAQIKKLLSVKSKIPEKLLNRGVYLEKNMVKLGDSYRKNVDKAWEMKSKLSLQLNELANEIVLQEIRNGRFK